MVAKGSWTESEFSSLVQAKTGIATLTVKYLGYKNIDRVHQYVHHFGSKVHGIVMPVLGNHQSAASPA